MADTSFLNKYRYFTHPGIAVNEHFVRYTLLPGILSQAKLGNAGYIYLKYDEELERLPLTEAIVLTIDWFNQNQLLSSDDEGKLLKALDPGNYLDIGLYLNGKFTHHSEKSLNLTTTILENVERYRDSQKQAPSPVEVKAYDILSEYNRVYQEVYRLMQQGVPAQLAAELIPKGMASIGGSQYQTAALARLVARNLGALESARTSSPTQELSSHAVTRELERVIRANPSLAGLLVVLGDPAAEAKLSQLVETTAHSYAQAGGNIDNLVRLERQAPDAASDALPTHTELIKAIAPLLTFSSDKERSLFAKSLLEETVRSSTTPLTATQIINLATKRLNLSTDQTNQITATLHASGLDVALEYRQQELVILVGGNRLSRAEIKLLQAGISPFASHYFTKQEAIKAIRLKEAKLLEEFNAAHNPGGQDPTKNFSSLEEAYAYEAALPNPSLPRLRQARALSDERGIYLDLSPLQERLLAKTRFGRFVRDSRSRAEAARSSMWDRYASFTDNLPWNKASRKLFDWYEKLEEKLVVTLPFTKGKVKIPLLNPLGWAFNSWHGYQYKTSIKWLKALRGTKSPFGKFGQFVLRNAVKGDFNWGSGIYHGTRELWGRSLNYVVRLASKGKYATAKAFGTASIKWLTDVGGKLLLKVGGEALLKLGAKAGVALVAAGTVIGSIVSIGLGVLMVVDLVKLGYDLVKEFITNIEFRNFALKIGGIGAAVATFFAGLPLLLVGGLGFIASGLGLALFITLGMTAFGTFYQWSASTAAKIDPGVGLFTAIVCNQEKENSSANITSVTISDPTAMAAVCIAKVLNECSMNPLFGSALSTPKWQCVLAALLIPGAAEQLYKSAFSVWDGWTKEPHLQCVGLAAASAGSDFPQTDARNYATSIPPGWTKGSCKQGSLFVDANGDPGHIGVVIDCDAGANIICVDANLTGPGLVRDQSTCRYPKSLISAYLNKI